MKRRVVAMVRMILAGVLLPAGASVPASATELKVPVSVAMRGAVAEIAADFEKKTGHTVKVLSLAPGQINAMLKAGESADVVVQIDSALPEIEQAGAVKQGRVALGSTGFGIAARAGDTVADVSTMEGLKSALTGAAKVVYNDPAVTPSGKLLLSIADKLGVAEQVKAKSQVVGPGANVSTMAKDTGAGPVIALAVLVEIAHPGAKVVGALPKEVQVPLPYSAVLGAKLADEAAARAFLQALGTSDAKKVYARAGFEVKE